MRDVVKPVRFTSVVLITERQLLAFASLLQALEQETPSRPSSLPIRHLLVAVPTHYWGDVAKEKKDKALRLQETIRSLLAMAAPTLQTLALYGTHFDVVAPEFTFPLLEALCVERFNIMRKDFSILPSLRRLHLTEYSGWPGFWTLLAQAAPALTHIRLTGLSQDVDLPRIIRNLLDLPVPDTPETRMSLDLIPPYPPGAPEAAAADALSSLRTIIVEPHEYQGGGFCGTGMIMHIQMKCGLGATAQECKQGLGRGVLYLLPDTAGYPVSEARREWLKLVEGGSGPWVTPEERAVRPPLAAAAVVRKPTMTTRINSALRSAQNSIKSRMRGGK
ncbi:hypothetical protein PsYK624_158960 [Phanerochaete sordida]|uniref:F-box domain-containing protein n=1 Tax=Phanerochaete sordida TaxID=48140 RepID=A0A9P3LLR0_9APHY|nr:hypothetical protein PsYK624_158960 [Phanerochaete sordida]